MPTFGSLFAGIGGMDLGLERAGWECKWQVEIDEWCRRVLAKHWPDVPRYGDITAIAGTELERVDLVCGGFPCPPVSLGHAKRKGIEDDRWLWPEFARIVRVARPRIVLVENVPGLLSANDGRAMSSVLGDLAALGYDCEWDCLPAAAVGAPHLRYRVFVVAYSTTDRLNTEGEPRNGDGRDSHGRREVAIAHTADPKRRTHRSLPGTSRAFKVFEPRREVGGTGPLAEWWATEPGVGRVANGVPDRVERLRGLGNAVVPQVAEWIGRRLMEVA